MKDLEGLIRLKGDLNQKIAVARQEEIQEIIRNIFLLMHDYEISPEDLGFSSLLGSTATVRYRDPESGKVWTGNGRTPSWIKGKDRDKFRVR